MKTNKFPANLYYLTAYLPARVGYVKEVIKRLQDKRSITGKPYTEAIVNSAVRGWIEDPNIRKALEDMVRERAESLGTTIDISRPAPSVSINALVE